MISLALYQPDIPQNVGAAIRLCACLGLRLDVIHPCGFPWDMRKIKQSGMDYIDLVELVQHDSWEAFNKAYPSERKILMTTKSSADYTKFKFIDGDILIAGRESAGVPDHVHESVDERVVIDMHGKARSLNIINACAMITGEALRQTK